MKKNKNSTIERAINDKPIVLPVHEPIPVPAPIKPKLEVQSTPEPAPQTKAEAPAPIQIPKTYRVKVTSPKLRKRNLPSLSGSVIDYITDQGIYEIKDTVNGWGQLTSGEWIMLQFTQIV